MRQKMTFERNIKDGILTVLELSEVDPGVVMPLHEEDYDLREIVEASGQGLEQFKAVLRRKSLFPTHDLCAKLFEGTKGFFKNESEEKITIEYNDTESFPVEEEFHLEESDVELDALLDEDGDTKEDEIKEIDSEDDTPKFTPEDTSEHEN
ncbi:hypothetical protein [Desulfospira joergensenii]|uniref:hypothetical protein n=1 Tax=Desulfospira joergensenii TaxID=53329 RepID=UPI0003B32982|nr:hypothetical protein [Desulfospira joergensenii]